MKKILAIGFTLLLILLGVMNHHEESNKPTSFSINQHVLPYDLELMKAIDATKWIDLSNPPTVKTMEPVEEEFQIENYEQEKHCYLDGTECIYFYEGASEEDAVPINERLESRLEMIDKVKMPRIYIIQNVVMMYFSTSQNQYVLEETLQGAINSLK